MNNIQILSYNDRLIRQTVNEDGEILFCATDVAKALGYRDAHNVMRVLDEEDAPQLVRCVDAAGREQEMNFITRDQVFEVLGSLKTERTKPFRRWLYHEVLPAIMDTGSYSINPPAIQYKSKSITPEKASELLKTKDEKIKELLPFKYEIERRQDVASEYRESHRRSSIWIINIDTGKKSTLRNVPYDVLMYLKKLSKVERGMLFHKWKHEHNFNEFIRYRMRKEGFKL